MGTSLRLATFVLVGVTLMEILSSIMTVGIGLSSSSQLFPAGIVRLASARRSSGSAVPASQTPGNGDVSSSLVTLPGVRP